MKIYTFGHGARSLDDFRSALDLCQIDILVDLRKKPYSRYYPHFNKNNLKKEFGEKYIFGGDYLGGSPEFHNDLLEYIKNRGENKNKSKNKLFQLIDENLKNKIFSGKNEFSNNEKRKAWITENFLHRYIPEKSEKKAIDFLKELFKKYQNKKICFFCSEKEPTHCHRYYLLEQKWLKNFSGIEIIHIEDLIEIEKTKKENKKSGQLILVK